MENYYDSVAPKGDASGFASGNRDATVDNHLTKGPHNTTISNSTTQSSSVAGGGRIGPAPHTNGPHSSDWKNIMDPRHDANSNTAQIRAEAKADARAEAEAQVESDKSAEIERAIANTKAQGDAEERDEIERAVAAANRQAEAGKRAELERALADAERGHRTQLYQARADGQAEIQVEAARRAEAERATAEAVRLAEAERLRAGAPPSASHGIGKAAKNIAKVVHGAGTSVKGTVQGAIDQKLGHHEAAKKHQETAVRGERMIANNDFVHADRGNST